MDCNTLIKKKSLFLVCGLGGVGKTSLSAALALAAAIQGRRSLVLTVDPAKRLAQALGLKKSSDQIESVADHQSHPELIPKQGKFHALMLNPKSIFDDVVRKYTKDEGVREAILSNALYENLSTMLAGSQEYMAMEKLYELVKANQYDTIVVDTPPARHAIDFLESPLKLTRALNDSLLKYIISPSVQLGHLGSKLLNAFSRLTGAGLLQDIAGLFGNSMELLDGFVERAGIVQKLLRDRSTAFLLVTSARRLRHQDAIDFVRELKDLNFPYAGLMVNRLPFGVQDTKQLKKSISEGEKAEETFYQEAAKLLHENVLRKKQLEAALQLILQQSAYQAWVPSLSDAANNLKTLTKIAHYL